MFTDLILLIGTNPLPNFVVIDYFLNKNPNLNNIWLICSQSNHSQGGTSTIAENLMYFVRERHSEKFFDIKLEALTDVSSKSKIESDLAETDFITEIKEDNRYFHFNYTGGTKAMSTHVHSILSGIKNDKSEFSYLDTRNFRLMRDDKEQPIESEMLKKVTISADELIKLHGWNKEEDEIHSVIIGNGAAMDAFIELIGGEKSDADKVRNALYFEEGAYSRERFKRVKKTFTLTKENIGCLSKIIDEEKRKPLTKVFEDFSKTKTKDEEHLIKITKDRLGTDKPYADLLLQLADIKIKDPKWPKNKGQLSFKGFKPNVKFQTINNVLPEHLRVFDKCGNFNEDINFKNDNYKKAVQFFDGKWLETYIFHLIKSELDKFPNVSVVNNIKPYKKVRTSETGEKKKVDFEIDIVVIDGYHLTGISCTTDKKKDVCKNKGFEILHRTKQMGGDEAKSILITFMNDKIKQEVQTELETTTGTIGGNVLVLGSNDLKKETLIGKVVNFIKPVQ